MAYLYSGESVRRGSRAKKCLCGSTVRMSEFSLWWYVICDKTKTLYVPGALLCRNDYWLCCLAPFRLETQVIFIGISSQIKNVFDLLEVVVQCPACKSSWSNVWHCCVVPELPVSSPRRRLNQITTQALSPNFFCCHFEYFFSENIGTTDHKHANCSHCITVSVTS